MLSTYRYFRDLQSYHKMARLGIKPQAAFSTAASKPVKCCEKRAAYKGNRLE